MLSILALVAMIVAAYQVYKTASGNGHSGVLWAGIALAVGIGFQLVIPILIGLVLGVIYISTGTPVEELQNKINGPAMVIGIITIALSFFGVWLVYRHVSKIPDDAAVDHVPPPPTFDGNE